MNTLRKIADAVRNSRLQTKLILSYVILITVPLILFSVSYYRLGKETIMDMAQKDVYTIVQKNNEIIDAKLSRVREMIYAFMEDPDFNEVFAGVDPDNKRQILDADLKITAILNKYFAQSQDIYSVQVATTYYTFGQDISANNEHGKNFIPKGAFQKSDLFDVAYAGDGKIVWVPTYDFSKMFDVDYLKDAEIDYKHLLSAVRKINGSFKRSDGSFNQQLEKPVLIVNFKETLFGGVFEGSLPTKGSYYFVTDEAGRIISHQDETLLAGRLTWTGLQSIASEKSGVRLIEIDGAPKVVCFDRSSITGWYSVAVIPPEQLLDPVMSKLIRNILLPVGLLTLLFVAFSSYLSGIITHPIRTVIRAITNTGEGKFTVKFKEHGSYEFKVLMRKFNDMNDNIHKLIEENYGSQIREKEAEIKALNLQLDPHFMHNTLNLISLISMEKGEDEISDIIMSLSYMMKYIVKQEGLVTFDEDFTYLKSYITIMTKRFEGKFTVDYDVDPALLSGKVPKFFLQPIVENALIHGFNHMDRPGVLHIGCFVNDGVRHFVVDDNGKGMTAEEMVRLMNPDGAGVGLNNVNRRIQVIFGEEYGVTVQSAQNGGTTVTVRLPAEEAARKEGAV